MNIGFILKIIALFTRDTSRELTILQISKQARLSYNAAHRTVKALIKENVLNMRRIGNSTVISLNNIPLTLGYLGLAESNVSTNTKQLLKRIEEHEKRLG